MDFCLICDDPHPRHELKDGICLDCRAAVNDKPKHKPGLGMFRDPNVLLGVNIEPKERKG